MLCTKCNKETVDGNFCVHCGNSLSAVEQEPTLYELKESWSCLHYRRIGKATIECYEYVWKMFTPLYNYPFSKIRASDIQNLIDSNSHLSKSAIGKLKTLYSLLCRHAINERIVPHNFTAYLYNSGQPQKTTEIFTDNDIALLQDCVEERTSKYWKDARIVLCLIFSGYRPNELFSITKDKVFLEEKYLISGSKTTAGKNRIVPISECILPYISELFKESFIFSNNSPYLFQSSKGNKINLKHWRERRFYPLMQELSINNSNKKNTPYSARHTFATLCFRANVNDDIKIKMIGHTDVSLTNEVYTHFSIDQYKQEITKIDKLASGFGT